MDWSATDAALLVASGRVSLQIAVAAALVLFSAVVLLTVSILIYRAWLLARRAYRQRRRRLYETGVENVLLGKSPESVLEAFRPKRWGDEPIVLALMLDYMQHLSGVPFEVMREAAVRLGLVERCLRDLRARRSPLRGQAMEALGIMRAPQAIVAILDILENEPMSMKLVALRSLAQIGDPAVLPYFIRAAETLPPAMMLRLASLVLEFGSPGRVALAGLINRRPDAFPPRVMRIILEEAAQA